MRQKTRKIPFANEDFKTVIAVPSDRFQHISQKFECYWLKNRMGNEDSNEPITIPMRLSPYDVPSNHFPILLNT